MKVHKLELKYQFIVVFKIKINIKNTERFLNYENTDLSRFPVQN
jgi:hypothetical protein